MPYVYTSQVQKGDEDAAKVVLKEKESTKIALERASSKAQINYALAAKLAAKIGKSRASVDWAHSLLLAFVVEFCLDQTIHHYIVQATNRMPS